MKKLLTVVVIAFAAATLLASQAFASPAQCPKVWKNGYYVCAIADNW
jgi:hypothetical protein